MIARLQAADGSGPPRTISPEGQPTDPANVNATSGGQHVYDVSADGQRFLTLKVEEEVRELGRAELVVVQNWLPRIRRAGEAGE